MKYLLHQENEVISVFFRLTEYSAVIGAFASKLCVLSQSVRHTTLTSCW